MERNKVIYNGVTLIDLTEDTVAANLLMSGYTAHLSSGAKVTGTYTPPEFVTVYFKNTDPDDSVGNVGDLWVKVAD